MYSLVHRPPARVGLGTRLENAWAMGCTLQHSHAICATMHMYIVYSRAPYVHVTGVVLHGGVHMT